MVVNVICHMTSCDQIVLASSSSMFWGVLDSMAALLDLVDSRRTYSYRAVLFKKARIRRFYLSQRRTKKEKSTSSLSLSSSTFEVWV